MPSRHELERRFLTILSEVCQRVFDETRELSEEELFEMVRDLEDKTSILFMVQATAAPDSTDEESSSTLVSEDGKEEIS